MRWKVTIILLLLNIVTFYGIFFFKEHAPNKEARTKTTLGTAIVDIDRIEIINKAFKEPRIFERHNGQWKITSPIEWPANLFAIQRIITQLQFLIHEARFSIEEIQQTGQSLEDYGLKDPSILLKFRGINGEHTLAIGNATHLGNRVYVMDPDQKNILVVKDSLLDSIAANLEDLRAQQIFNIPLYELNKLKIQLLSPHNLKIWLSKEKDSWAFDAPIQTKANNTLVNNAINQLTAINTHRIVFGDEADQAHILLHNPLMRVTLEGSNQKQTLIVAGSGKQTNDENYYYAQLEDNATIFTVPAKPFDSLQDAQQVLREKQLITIKTDALRNITISQSRKKIQLQKLENEDWQLVNSSPTGKLVTTAADTGELERIQKRLQALEVIAFASDAPSSADLENYGFNDPQRIIELDADKKQTLIIGGIDAQSGNLYAKLAESPYVYRVNPNILSFFPLNELHYKMRLMDKLPKGAIINGLKVVYLGSNEKILFEQQLDSANSDWESVLAQLPPQKKQSILGIIEGIKRFSVRNYLKNNFEKMVTLDEQTQFPWTLKVEAQVLFPGGDTSETKTIEYHFTKRLSGNLQIGGSAQKNVIFSAEQDWIDHLFIFHEAIQTLDETSS